MSAVQLLALAGGALVCGSAFGTLGGKLGAAATRLSARARQLADPDTLDRSRPVLAAPTAEEWTAWRRQHGIPEPAEQLPGVSYLAGGRP